MRDALKVLVMVMVGALAVPAWAHPFSTDDYSLRTSVKVNSKGQLATLVVLEVPIQFVQAGVGFEEGDSKRAQKKKEDAWNAKVWDQMAQGLTLTVNGAPVQGEWLPIEHELNGKAAEGFFVYMVGFRADEQLPAAGYTAVIDNQSFPDVPMVYSGSATAVGGYVLTRNSALDLLEEADAPLDSPGRWTRDAALRTLTLEVAAE